MRNKENIIKSYELAKEQYKQIGIDTDEVLKKLDEILVSVHCWQGDDVQGFENPEGLLTGGIQATGNYPGKSRTPEELREDLELVFQLVPGKHKVNLHAIYGEFGDAKIERDNIKPEHFQNWVTWAKKMGLGLDFNPTLFSHPLAENGTLSNPDEKIRKYWIDHCKASRKIGEYFGKELGIPCVTNIWIPDGYKDIPVDKYMPRKRLKDSLDEILKEEIDPKYNLDAVESKVFGLGLESYTVGSHEFYMGYAVKNNKLLCLDAGHFHPTEVISDKIPSVLLYLDQILLHVSRPVKWDSDHVVILDDELQAIANQIIRYNFEKRVHIGIDFFDASINRIAAWVIGVRNTRKALMIALLEPTEKLKEIELEGDFTSRLALLEEYKTYPTGAVWDYYCSQRGVYAGEDWLEIVKNYEKNELSKRV